MVKKETYMKVVTCSCCKGKGYTKNGMTESGSMIVRYVLRVEV